MYLARIDKHLIEDRLFHICQFHLYGCNSRSSMQLLIAVESNIAASHGVHIIHGLENHPDYKA